MKFRTKLIWLYAVFFLMVATGLGIYFYRYSAKQYLKEEKESLQLMAEQVQDQFYSLTDKMEYRMNFMLSDPEVRNAMLLLGDPKGVRMEYLDKARDTIQNSMIIDSVMSSFYRVVCFNENGEVIAMKSDKNEAINKKINWEAMPWLKQVEALQGKPFLVNRHKDTWGYRNEVEVFSLVKKVLGKNAGYIEIQFDAENLKEILKISNPAGEIILLSNDTEVLYSSIEDFTIEDLDSEEYLYGKDSGEKFGIRTVVRENRKPVMNQSAYLLKMSILITGVFYILLLSVVYIISNYLTKPLRKMRKVIESTEIENMGESVKFEEYDDEIIALSESYQAAMTRLKESMLEEKRMAVLQTEAQFDLLQAQVNPHFLYNVLNVISGKGIENGDDSICTMCGKLAAMLRYSSDTTHRYVAVSKEIEYLEQYLYLLKCRYDYKLNFDIQMEKEIEKQMIPKIVLQQMVENCMQHGFENKTQDMEIQIKGTRCGSKFRIEIQDNGQGFTEESLEYLQSEFAGIKEKILHSRENIQMQIGGMGLVNAYARLVLYYKDSVDIHLGNNSTGAIVWIQIPFDYKKENEHV